jgi:HAD superfamily hydrolase (TIGR01509 family)
MKALIFDFDGLILDTETPDYQSWQNVYKSYGIDLPLQLWLTFVGGNAETDFEPHEYLEQELNSTVDREQIWVSRRKSYLENLEDQTVLPGVVDLLEAARERGLKLAVASSSPENWVAGHLSRLKLEDYFDIIVTADDVEKTKPDPALFLMAAEKLEILPNEVIVLEDSENGVNGAKRANMFVVAVPNSITVGSDLSLADLQIRSLTEVTLDDLLAKAAER